jgi:glycosyltransferase involved in cell wall biosynthesis
MPRVSVIVPNYNHAPYLRQRIDSIFAQTYQDFELLLLDDNSTDGSQSILAEYSSEPRVRLYLNDRNSGSPFKQWNKGVHLARGEYVWIAESDDYADPQLLEIIVPLLDADKSIGFAYCRSWRVNEHGIDGFADYNLPNNSRWEADFWIDGHEFFRRYFALITPVPNASAVVFRKAMYQQVGGADESLRLCGDWKLWGTMALAGKVAYSSRPLNFFRYHANNARSRTAQAGNDIDEYLRVTQWVLNRVTLPEAELKAVCEARAQGWVPALMSFRTPTELRRRILTSIRAIDPHPARRILRPALATLYRKIRRHYREVSSFVSSNSSVSGATWRKAGQ